MKKNLLIACLVTTFCQAQNFETPNKKAFGKCLLAKSALYNNGSLDYSLVITYNTEGKILKKTETFSRNLNGPYTTEYTYEYDNNGNNNKTVTKQNGLLKYEIVKEYSQSNKLLKENMVKNGTTTAMISTLPNDIGDNFEKTYVGGATKETKQIDKNGNLISQEIINSEGKIQMSIKNEINKNGKITKSTTTDYVAKFVEEIIYTYENNGEIIGEVTMREGFPISSIVYNYTNNGLLKQQIHMNRFGKPDYYINYEYDNNKNISKQSLLNEKQELMNYTTYEYDNNKNETKESFVDKNGIVVGYKNWEYYCN